MAKPAGDEHSRGCRTCRYWRIGLIVIVAALLAVWLMRSLGD